jgi:hypothetical protein
MALPDRWLPGGGNRVADDQFPVYKDGACESGEYVKVGIKKKPHSVRGFFYSMR